MSLRRSKRHPPAAPSTVVFRWDLDKTYLRSEFQSWRGLVRIPFEKPEDKVTVPGVVPLLRNLREVALQSGREVRIYFISASPPQIAKAIKDKLALDGIAHDGIVFKNQLQHIVRGRFRNLREQVGFKLTELLNGRQAMPAQSSEVLFGDDWESDPIIYSLYADIVAGRVAPGDLDSILRAIGVDVRLITRAQELAGQIEPRDAVTRIYINLERRTPPKTFRFFGPRLVPAFNYFQTAACLYEQGHLTLPAVSEVAESLISGSAYTPQRLANSLDDISRRGHLSVASAVALRAYLQARQLMPPRPRETVVTSMWERLRRWLRAAPAPTANIDDTINYQTLVAEWRAAR